AKRWPAAVDFIAKNRINEFFGSDHGSVGIVMQGGMYNSVIRALQRLGLADTYGDTDVPLYVLNAVYPVVEHEFVSFCEGEHAVQAAAEGEPNYIE
ncbi:indolepyruvate ferredoxin oxidoreductase, partial [bacterium M00.F.Ca.ET.221.01.1.1]